MTEQTAELIRDYTEHIEAEKRLSSGTVANYLRDLKRFIRWYEEEGDTSRYFEATEIEANDLREWLMERTTQQDGRLKANRGRRIGASTINRELASLRSFFGYLLEKGVIKRDLFQRIPKQRSPKRLPVYIPESRMEQLLDHCHEAESESRDYAELRDALIIEMLYGCGLRLQELISTNWGDFRDDYRTLRVVGKGDKERLIPIVEPLREKILHYASLFEGQNICKDQKKALILSNKGERISRSAVYRIVRRKLGEEHIQGKRSPHVLRHTFATHLLNDGADMREIQELMGHSSLRATQVYTHNTITQLQKAYLKAHPREKGESVVPKE